MLTSDFFPCLVGSQCWRGRRLATASRTQKKSHREFCHLQNCVCSVRAHFPLSHGESRISSQQTRFLSAAEHSERGWSSAPQIQSVGTPHFHPPMLHARLAPVHASMMKCARSLPQYQSLKACSGVEISSQDVVKERSPFRSVPWQ